MRTMMAVFVMLLCLLPWQMGADYHYQPLAAPTRMPQPVRITVCDGEELILPHALLVDPDARSGFFYLAHAIHRAWEDLEGVPSQFGPYETRRSGGCGYVFGIILTEHMEFNKSFVNGEDSRRLALTSVTFRRLGIEREEAFNRLKSRKAAQGIAQMLPATYEALRERYPDADLLSFEAGLSSHLNSIKAALLYGDEALRPYHKWDETILFVDQVSKAQAAGYNAAPRTVWKALKKNGDLWEALLPGETQWYLVKYMWIRTQFIRTPDPLIASAF